MLGQGYAFAFFAIPLVRWFLNGRRNAAIEERNAARLAALNAVQRPTPQLAKKLNQAAQEAQRVMIRDRDIIYRYVPGLDLQAWCCIERVSEKWPLQFLGCAASSLLMFVVLPLG